MKRVKILTIIFTFWVLLIIMSASWLVYLLLDNVELIYKDSFFVIILFLACLSFFLSFFFIYQIIIDVKYEIKKAKATEKNIRDIYQYEQRFEPPSIYT